MRARLAMAGLLVAAAATVGGCMAQEAPGRYNKMTFDQSRRQSNVAHQERPAVVDGTTMERMETPAAAQPISNEDRQAFDAAVALAAELKYGDAAQAFARLIPRLESASAWNQAAESIFWLGYCREKLGNSEEAAKAYRRLQRAYPAAPAAKQAETRMELLKPTPQEKAPEP